MMYKLAQVYEKESLLDDANKWIIKACELDGTCDKYKYLHAVISRRLGKQELAFNILNNITMPTGDLLLDQDIYFELGRVCDKRADYEMAFSSYSLANLTQSKTIKKDVIVKERFIAHVDKVTENLSSDWVARWKTCDEIPADNLVFMVAFPRSGTTLLDQLLDGHSKVQVMEEVPILGKIIAQIVSSGHDYPVCIKKFNCKDIKKFRKYYFKETEKYIDLKPDSILVDKLPLNIVEIQLIQRLFPSSKIILSLRHPYDVCLSNFMQHFDLNDAMANFLTLEDTTRAYRKVMELWQKYINVLKLSYHAVRYEDLVDDTELQARALIGFLGLDWEAAMLNHVNHAKKRRLNTPSYQQVTQPIYNSSCYRWKNYEPYLSKLSVNLNELIESFGYSA